jgi:polyferredoxin
MELHRKIHLLPKPAKLLVGFFVLTLSFGYYTGLLFVQENTNNTAAGVEEHYLGNEDDENAEIMKFKKAEKEIITTVHNHVISFSLIFLALGGILLITSIPKKLKKFLIVEPFISILLTFGGIWILWSGVLWFKYVIMFSGILLTLTFTTSVVLILLQLFKKNS